MNLPPSPATVVTAGVGLSVWRASMRAPGSGAPFSSRTLPVQGHAGGQRHPPEIGGVARRRA